MNPMLGWPYRVPATTPTTMLIASSDPPATPRPRPRPGREGLSGTFIARLWQREGRTASGTANIVNGPLNIPVGCIETDRG